MTDEAEPNPYSIIIVGTFRPQRQDDLRPEVRALIGEPFDWIYAGTQDDDQPYPGQTIWDSRDPRWPGYWVPKSDYPMTLALSERGRFTKS